MAAFNAITGEFSADPLGPSRPMSASRQAYSSMHLVNGEFSNSPVMLYKAEPTPDFGFNFFFRLYSRAILLQH